MTSAKNLTIGIVGGTGELGSALGRLWGAAGYTIVIGSRSKERAEEAAQELASGLGTVRGETNRDAARAGDIVVLTVPYAVHDLIVTEIKREVSGKIVVVTTVPLLPPAVSVVTVPPTGSPAVVAQHVLGPQAQVVSAFHTVGAGKLRGGQKADGDVLVFSDDAGAAEQVITLARVVATRAVNGGGLVNSIAAEALASVLIGINRRYGVRGAGISITGLGSTALHT